VCEMGLSCLCIFQLNNMWSSSRGVLSPVLFSIYIDSIIQRLRMFGYGCVIGGEFSGYIMYADDLVLVSRSACVLQKMFDICVVELNFIGLSFNFKNSCLLLFGPR